MPVHLALIQAASMLPNRQLEAQYAGKYKTVQVPDTC